MPPPVFTDRGDLRELLRDVEQRITERVSAVALHALAHEERWKGQLRAQSGAKDNEAKWKELVREVASYRDRWDISNETLPLGPLPNHSNWEQTDQRARVEAVIIAARRRVPVSPGLPSVNDPQATPHTQVPPVTLSL